MPTPRAFLAALTVLVAVGLSRHARAQELETETSRSLEPGQLEAGAGFEYQLSADGTEAALPLFAEAGLVDRVELLVEPVVFAHIAPASGAGATGFGDVEATVTGRVVDEGARIPAIALAGEVKLPAARDPQIGTGKTDATFYVILSKRFGRLDTHLNGGYAIIGAPDAIMIPVKNIWSAAAAGRLELGRVDVFAEVLGNTGAVPDAEGSAFSEVTGAELVGTIGGGYRLTRSVLLSLGVSVDNNAAVLLHPGVTIFSDGWSTRR
ncbi:MAG: hypothetical protein H6709_10405 [Kofleriaceae bacterium]|nr:hypothetical protein [Myxococcales bacterium]MCB9564146.1 hypothetical protein [Kofleriaceae bacterium]MCB9572487.1 hypothetical protein [Kofleriaceae bacterium]